MAAHTLVVLVACLALAHGGVQRRDAPSGLEQIQKHAEEFHKTLSEQFNQLVNSKDSENFNKALKEGSDTVLQQLSSLSTSLQAAMNDANGKAKEALQSSQANVQKQIDELRKAHPDVEKQAGVLKDKIQAALTSAVQESQKLAKEVSANVGEAGKKLEPQLKQAYDDLVKQAQEVHKKLEEASKQ